MKFSTEKKTSLCIYTEVDFGTEKMECEVRALRKELEETRTALRLQTVRCRQLVAAFTTKLQEKEAEVRAGRELRDQQLERVLRALLVLEARLRREQRHIRQQLADRDDVIQAQQLEIARLSRARQYGALKPSSGEENEDKYNSGKESLESSGHSSCADESMIHRYDWQVMRKPQETQDESTSSQEDEPVRNGTHELLKSPATYFVRFKKNTRNRLNTLGSYRPISKRRDMLSAEKSNISHEYNRVEEQIEFESENVELKDETQDLDDGCHEDEFGTSDLYKDYQHNPVLECVNQILLRDQEEMETTTYRQEVKSKPVSKGKGRFSYHCHSIKEEQDEEGEEETVKQQIENLSLSNSGLSDVHVESSDKENCAEQNNDPASETIKWLAKDKTPSPPIKSQHLEEKACLQMASQRLTLARNLEFEELDKKKGTNETFTSTLNSPKKKNSILLNKNQIPPALPPKPPQLGAKGLYQKKINNTKLNQVSNFQHNALKQPLEQDVNQSYHKESENKTSVENIIQRAAISNETRLIPPHLPEKPRQRQILSNGSLKLALNQECAHQAVTNGNDNRQEKNNNICLTSPSLGNSVDNLNLSDIHNHSNTPKHQIRNGGPITTVKSDNQLDVTERHNQDSRRHKVSIHNSSMKGSMEELSNSPKTPPQINHCGKIRVGSSVSSLITGSSGNSIVSELTKGESEERIALPRVSQIVRRFEDLGNSGMGRESPEENDEDEDGDNTLRRNFEEFKLEDVDMDSVGSSEDGGRPAGDGAEARAAVLQNGNGANVGNGGTYEHFLEATGLSQKSILTPSRMYSNHRNVMKPKDVKHRNRVLKAAAVNGASANNGPVVKYWIEPFL